MLVVQLLERSFRNGLKLLSPFQQDDSFFDSLYLAEKSNSVGRYLALCSQCLVHVKKSHRITSTGEVETNGALYHTSASLYASRLEAVRVAIKVAKLWTPNQLVAIGTVECKAIGAPKPLHITGCLPPHQTNRTFGFDTDVFFAVAAVVSVWIAANAIRTQQCAALPARLDVVH